MQEISSKTPTIYAVAEKAGVSRGTVDRVVFGRGRVSQETREKVLKAIADLNYTPNSNASKLATRKEYLFCCLIPQYNSGDYWEEMNKGFLSAAKEFSSYNIRLNIHYYDQRDICSFKEESRKILEEKPSGVILNAVFREEVSTFADELTQKAIPYAFVDNKIDELDYTLYYGVDPYKSGALGAYLLTRHSTVEEVALVRLLRDSSHKADPNRPRRHGFMDYIEDNCPECIVRTVFIDPDDADASMKILEEFFRKHRGIHHIAMTNSRVFLLRDYLQKHPDPERTVVAFDDLEKNLDCLRDGLVDSLVTRHIARQAYDAFFSFAECVIRHAKPEKRNNYVHMDILTRMNLDNY